MIPVTFHDFSQENNEQFTLENPTHASPATGHEDRQRHQALTWSLG